MGGGRTRRLKAGPVRKAVYGQYPRGGSPNDHSSPGASGQASA